MKPNIDVCRQCKYHRKFVLNKHLSLEECLAPDIPMSNTRAILENAAGFPGRYIEGFEIPKTCPFSLEHVVA